MLPEFYGNIETSPGAGAVFDLVRDYTGQISQPLERYLSDEPLTEQHLQGLKPLYFC